MREVRPLDPVLAAQHCDNTVINSHYTLLSFLPKNLYEQFRRPLNFYFLLVAMLQFISIIAPVNPMSTLLPLAFALSLTAVKEGYDDVKRHRHDAAYNSKMRSVLDVLTAQWKPKMNSQIAVGDVILLKQNEDVPCDIVPLAATGKVVFVRTDNLDGEIDLKVRELLPAPFHPASHSADALNSGATLDNSVQAPHLSMSDPLAVLVTKLRDLRLTCPPPSAVLDSFDGYAEYNEPSKEHVQLTPTIIATATTSTHDAKVPLTHMNLLLQSSVVKNTEAVIGVAVYTGDETKCGMNKYEPETKWAKIDKDVSKYSVLIFCCQLFSAAVFGCVGYNMNKRVGSRYWYLPEPATEVKAAIVIYPLRFFLLTTVMIPVSFKFVVDMSKYYMAMTVEWDVTMMHEGGDGHDSSNGNASAATRAAPLSAGCSVRNSSILEDLGQLDHVLADKTGTMTQNVMELQYVAVTPEYAVHVGALQLPSGVCASPSSTTVPSGVSAALGVGTASASVSSAIGSAEVTHFATMLALCNTVDVEQDVKGDGDHQTHLAAGAADVSLRYQAASPDEVALCCGAAKLGARLSAREGRRILVEVHGSTEEWLLHYVFPFASEKKSMGVIVEQTSTHRILFVVKGADDRIQGMLGSVATPRVGTPASTPTPPSHVDSSSAASGLCDFVVERLKAYAMGGLRTLLVAQKELSRASLQAFLQEARAAELATAHRQQYLDSLRAGMECDVAVLGITAIEDKLQEDVRETITDVIRAGVKVWMLTGDKVETAEQIGLSCGLYSPGDRVIRIVEGNNGEDGWEHELLCARTHGTSAVDNSNGPFSPSERLMEGGNSTNVHPTPAAFADNSGDRMVMIVQGGSVLDRILHTESLSCCFAELSQRCVSVICARTTPIQKAAVTNFVRERGSMTLAVGDGGNDVAMLQVAHVGVGIVGKEGRQAARAADFSVRQFSDLRPLLFVHGQLAYTRTAYIIKYSFYKSMLISFIQLAYNVVGTYCSGATFWNNFALTMWNGVYTLPQTLLYSLDRCAPRVTLEKAAPLYKLSRRNMDISTYEFFSFIVRGILQSVLALWLACHVFGSSFAFPRAGGTASNDIVFTVTYTAMIFSQVLVVFFESHSVTVHNALWLVGMPAFYVATALAFSSVPTLQYFGVMRRTLSVQMCLAAFGICCTIFLPFLIFVGVKSVVSPNSRDTFREEEVKSLRRELRVNAAFRRSQPLLVRHLGCLPEPASIHLPASAVSGEVDYRADATIV